MNPIILKDRAMADKKKTLLKVKQDASGWLSYYVSLANEEKWVEEYPESESQGGGEAQLRLIHKFPWE